MFHGRFGKVLGGSREVFGRVRGRFRGGFERIFEFFCDEAGRTNNDFADRRRIWRITREAFQVEGLTLMIRATRSRSIDR